MTCTQVPDYFLRNVYSPDASTHDFESYDDYFNNNECTATKCMPCKPEKFQNTDFKQKGKQPITKPDTKTSDLDVPKPPPAMECCQHRAQKTSRKFICNFAPSSASCISQCLEMERSRCAAFWKLIDQRPELESLMRIGEFEHINLPHIVEPRKPKDTSITCQNAEELRAKNKALHDEERERVNKRKRILDELQKKSGQPVCRTKGKFSESKKSEQEPVTDFSQLVLEMNAFDKMVHNPVRTRMNPPSATSLEWVHPDQRRRLSGAGQRKLSHPPIEEEEFVEDEEETLTDKGHENEFEFEEEHHNEEFESRHSGESIGDGVKKSKSL